MTGQWEYYGGRRVVVTGAASGMGHAVAGALVDAKAEVHALDIKPIKINGLASTHYADLRAESSIRTVFDGLPDHLDALFGCAGLPHTFPAEEIFEVGWLGTREVMDLALERMGEGSAVTTVSSIASAGWRRKEDTVKELVAQPDRAATWDWLEAHPDVLGDGYSTAKECIVVATFSRSVALAERGIRINCTSPGDTVTGMRDDFITHFGAENWELLPRPLGRPARAEEQASALLFLNSDAASYISGVNLVVDGAATPAMGMII